MLAIEKRIVDVLPSDLVWDGDAFVAHDGVAFSGYSKVICWDNITGTEDHVVYTSEAGEVGLSEAMQRQLPVITCESPSEDDVEAARIYARHYKDADFTEVRVRSGSAY